MSTSAALDQSAAALSPVTVSLSARDLAILAELSVRLGISANDIIRRAIASEKLLQDQKQSGRQIRVYEGESIKGFILPA